MTTHYLDSRGVVRQLVTPAELRAALEKSGDDLSRPSYFDEHDEWFVQDDHEEKKTP